MKILIISLFYLTPLLSLGTIEETCNDHKDPIVNALEQQLLKEGLIEKGNKLHLKLTSRYFSINSIRQSKEIWLRYKKLYEQVSGEQLKKGSYYIYRRNGKG